VSRRAASAHVAAASLPCQAGCSEVKIHSCLYKNRHDVVSVVHVHPDYVVLMSVLGNGIKPMAQEGVDLVLTDLGMPGMNGFEVARRIRGAHPAIPVVLVTGWGAEVDPQAVRESGVVKVVAKPFGYQELLYMVQEVLNWKTIA